MEYEKNDIRKDRGCQREIESLEIDCPTEPEPCPWRGKLTAMEEHMETKCPKRLVLCSQGCGGQYREDELEYHMTTECAYRVTECQYCDERIPELSMQVHVLW
jgi:TNF receptor-associated factor 4